MPQRIANVAITLHREGKRVDVRAGQLFNFQAKELEDLKKLNPDAVRLPRNESVTIDNEDGTITDDGANSGDNNNTDGTKTVKAAKQSGPAKADKKKEDAKAVKDEGSADDGSDL